MKRRDFLGTSSIFSMTAAFFGLPFGYFVGTPFKKPDYLALNSQTKGILFFESNFNRIFLRILNRNTTGGSVFGECIKAYQNIKDWHPETWIKAWAELAARVEEYAQAAKTDKDFLSARDAYLRAWNYYRAAEVMCSPKDERHRQYYDKSEICFKAAGALFNPPIEYVEYPYEKKFLPAYYLKTPVAKGKRPTILLISGNEGGKEEMFFWLGRAAIDRGYNALLFEGPGQRGTLHRHPDMVFRPDYEVPVAAALNYLMTRKDVDKKRIAIAGASFGGYLTPRAAIFEKRISALLAFPPIVNVNKFFEESGKYLEPPTPPPDAPKQVEAWSHIKWAYGENYEPEKWNFEELVKKISCPTLALYSEWEVENGYNQFELFYDQLVCPKRSPFFSHEEGAGAHIAANNSYRFHQIVFKWLREIWT